MPRIASLALVLAAFAGCSTFDTGRATVATFTVDAATAPCTGVGPQTCLRVRRAPEADWELFYDAIEGFDYEPGFVYLIEVEVREVADPPADGSSLRYTLIRVVEKTAT